MQPPSGGCVLKLLLMKFTMGILLQPPSGGCVLKPSPNKADALVMWQPPSGGCVLKHAFRILAEVVIKAAAFGRLCVETLFFR